MPAIAIMGGLAAAGGISSYVGAGNAANAQTRAAESGISTVGQSEQNALGLQNQAASQISGQLTPYQALGSQGANLLAGQFGAAAAPNTTGALAPTSLTQPWATPFNAPTANQAATTPGEQFILQSGENALQNSAAAQGNLLTGATAKGLENYAGNVASTYYQQAYNNALQQYQQNYNIFQGNQGNLYNRLMGITGAGMNASALGANASLGLAGLGSNTLMGGANTIAQLLGAKGAAQASGSVGQANALSGMFNSLSGLAMGNELGLFGNPVTSGAQGGLSPNMFAAQNEVNPANNFNNLGLTMASSYAPPPLPTPSLFNNFVPQG